MSAEMDAERAARRKLEEAQRRLLLALRAHAIVLPAPVGAALRAVEQAKAALAVAEATPRPWPKL